MKNVTVKRDGNQLIITCDLTQEHGLSKSEKTQIVATTGGNVAVANAGGKPVYLGLNLYTYAGRKSD
jgi:hypothetical protein